MQKQPLTLRLCVPPFPHARDRQSRIASVYGHLRNSVLPLNSYFEDTMILTRFAVCSSRQSKPVTRIVCDSRAQAESELEKIRQADADDPEGAYWIAEVGAESEAWRWLAPSESD